MATLRTLPANLVAILPTLSMDQVATAATIANARALAAPSGSRASAFWQGRREAARAEADRRGFYLHRSHPEYPYGFSRKAVPA